MARLSNNLIGLLNVLTLIVSIPIILASVWLRSQAVTECDRLLELPLLALGVVLLLVSLLGLVGSCCRVTFFLWLYLSLMLLLIVGVFCFTIFAFVVTNKAVGDQISGRVYLEHTVGNYSHWLQNHVVNGKNWDKIRSCLIDAEVCRSPGDGVHQETAEFYKNNLSPIQWGCCKPPDYCLLEQKNETFWAVPKSGAAAKEGDCMTWSNHQRTLCYDCISCKAGVLYNLRREWRKLATFNIYVLAFLIVVYSIGCCAFKNNRGDNYTRYRGYH